jgi:demethylmenaquinone methyltransferase/2-methoxy-6-polyprenyl-1,4-benzoquinol methylase
MPDPAEVQAMFGRIAGRYDLLNRVLSLGVDRSWRKRAADAAGIGPRAICVDVACGTGDLALELEGRGAGVVGVDFTPEMLPRARAKAGVRRALFVRGDALRIPLRSDIADAATIAFGLRNLEDRRAGLVELARVVRPGGRVVVLEFSLPPGPLLSRLYRRYFTRLLPRLGGAVSGDRGAYEYLPRTVLAWPSPDELEGELRGVGLVDTGHRLLTRGIACLHWGTRAR